MKQLLKKNSTAYIRAIYYKTEMVKHEVATNSEPLYHQSTLIVSGPKDVSPINLGELKKKKAPYYTKL